MKKTEVVAKPSSNVHSISYDGQTKRMAVKFKGKTKLTTYHYDNVPSSVMDELLEDSEKAEFSYGRWIRRTIVGNYTFTKEA